MVGSKVASYSLDVEWKSVQTKAAMLSFSDLKTYSMTHMNPNTFEYVDPHATNHKHDGHKEAHAHSETSGKVKNSGDIATRSVKIVAAWYDKEGKLSGVDWQVAKTSLAKGEEAAFVIMTHRASGYYSLFAESDDYVAMLAENNSRIIPVYEAPKSIQYATDAVSMSEVVFEENRKRVSSLAVGHQAQLVSTIMSKLDTPQKFVCIFQISDRDGMTVTLSWIASEIAPGGSADVSVSWMPESEGAHTVQVFLWHSMTNPLPLTEASKFIVNISA
jgi:hypothetical protein